MLNSALAGAEQYSLLSTRDPLSPRQREWVEELRREKAEKEKKTRELNEKLQGWILEAETEHQEEEVANSVICFHWNGTLHDLSFKMFDHRFFGTEARRRVRLALGLDPNEPPKFIRFLHPPRAPRGIRAVPWKRGFRTSRSSSSKLTKRHAKRHSRRSNGKA